MRANINVCTFIVDIGGSEQNPAIWNNAKLYAKSNYFTQWKSDALVLLLQQLLHLVVSYPMNIFRHREKESQIIADFKHI